jgi:hypothetical protein
MKTLIELGGINIYVAQKKSGKAVLSALLSDARSGPIQSSRGHYLASHHPVIFVVDAEGQLAKKDFRYFSGLAKVKGKLSTNGDLILEEPLNGFMPNSDPPYSVLPSVAKAQAKLGNTTNLAGRIDFDGGVISKVHGPCEVVGWDLGQGVALRGIEVYPFVAVVHRLLIEFESEEQLSLEYNDALTLKSVSFNLPTAKDGRTRIGNHCAEDILSWGQLRQSRPTESIDHDFEWLWDVLEDRHEDLKPVPILIPTAKSQEDGMDKQGCLPAECNGCFARIGN